MQALQVIWPPLSRGIAAGLSFRCIAQRIGHSVSTVSRELARHGEREQYRANTAGESVWANTKRPCQRQ
ncbi:helix-turn-helix domain-containing protein [Onishia taeanensis]|uniref:helix-turn-helix domain-containing protein n=1 Tax=Onishia taeanensis TaxID=284577 RepID=UPI001581918B|nr:helix-turn-helix domain-containing protein [Halomonas taeanensis]